MPAPDIGTENTVQWGDSGCRSPEGTCGLERDNQETSSPPSTAFLAREEGAEGLWPPDATEQGERWWRQREGLLSSSMCKGTEVWQCGTVGLGAGAVQGSEAEEPAVAGRGSWETQTRSGAAREGGTVTALKLGGGWSNWQMESSSPNPRAEQVLELTVTRVWTQAAEERGQGQRTSRRGRP